jgi:hypothetical protein
VGIVKSAFEKAMEKAAEIGELTPEEKETLKDKENLKDTLAEYYKGGLNFDGLWTKLKVFKPVFLKEAQLSMLSSIRLGNIPEEFRLRKDGILAVEALKENKNISTLENLLNSIERLQKEYEDLKKQAVEQLRKAIEDNPQMRVKPVKTPDGRTVLQQTVSVDEAVQGRVTEFLDEHEKRYETMFNRVTDELKKELLRS